MKTSRITVSVFWGEQTHGQIFLCTAKICRAHSRILKSVSPGSHWINEYERLFFLSLHPWSYFKELCWSGIKWNKPVIFHLFMFPWVQFSSFLYFKKHFGTTDTPILDFWWCLPGFQSQAGPVSCVISCLHAMDSSDSPLVQYLLISWWSAWQPSLFDTCACRSCVHKHWLGFETTTQYHILHLAS